MQGLAPFLGWSHSFVHHMQKVLGSALVGLRKAPAWDSVSAIRQY